VRPSYVAATRVAMRGAVCRRRRVPARGVATAQVRSTQRAASITTR